MQTVRAQTEPPGEPREAPWPEEPTPDSEPAGEPRESPWPDSDDDSAGE